MKVRSREAAADILERFVDSRLGPWEWDDFVGVSQSDPQLEDVRKTCLRVREEYPAGAIGWCSAEGMAELRRVAATLRSAGNVRLPETSEPNFIDRNVQKT